MPPFVASLVFTVGILGLFTLDRDREARTSKALWVPLVWLFIVGSRPVSQWLQLGIAFNSTARYLEGSPVDRTVFIVLAAAGVMILISRWHQVGPLLRSNPPILLFFAYCALSVFWSDYSFVAFKRWIRAVGDLVMVLIVLTDFEPEAAFRRLLAWLGFVLVPISVLFIKYYPDLGRSYNQWTWTPMHCGITTNKNELGMICLIFGLASLWRFLGAYGDHKGGERTQQLTAHGIILAMVLWLFWIGNSMTSFSCLILAGGLMVMMNLSRLARKPAAVHLLTATVVSVPLFALFSDSGGFLVQSLGRDSTLTGRTGLWDMVLGLVKNPLLGTGFQSFWLGDRLQTVWNVYQGIIEAHNGYLEVYLNLGWVGVALLGIIIVTGYRNVVRALCQASEVGRIRLAFLVGAVVYNFTEATFGGSAMWIMFLWATMAIPKAHVLQSSSSLDIDYTAHPPEWQPSVDGVLGGETPDGTVWSLSRQVAHSGHLPLSGLRRLVSCGVWVTVLPLLGDSCRQASQP